MQSLIERKKLKKRVSIINELLNKKEFLFSLSAYSNYDYDTLITNICYIINYYLNSDDPTIETDIEILLSKCQKDLSRAYIYYPTNSYFKWPITIIGFDPSSITTKKYLIELKQIEKLITLNPLSSSAQLEFDQDLKKSLLSSLTSPDILFKSILKTPRNEHPSYNQDERSHYYSILQKRLQNIPSDSYKTCAKKAYRWFNAFVPKKPLLVVLPKYLLAKANKEPISPLSLAIIELPTKYTLEKLCSHSNQPKKEPILPEPTYYVSYSRFERIPINTEFVYHNEELTGDLDYDIDLIYGALDYNGTRSKIGTSPYLNMQKIKSTYDMIVQKTKNQYEIKNGRHRLLYAKNFYVQNYDYFVSQNSLDILKELVTLIINVEHFIEDEDLNKLLEILYHKYQAKFIKYDVTNDEPGIIIIIKNKAYAINNLQELQDLLNNLEANNPLNKYFISPNQEIPSYNSNDIMNYLILTLKEKIYTMNYLEIIKYLLTNGFYLNNQYYKPKTIDYFALYNKYLHLRSMISLSELNNQPLRIVENALNNAHLEEIGHIVMSIILTNEEYISLDWPSLLSILKECEELKGYDDETITKAANYMGYQALKYNDIMHKNPSKLSKIWYNKNR